jgi:hypothetical protein
MDDAENRRVCSDAERECQHCDGGEPRIPKQSADCVPDIAPQVIDPPEGAVVTL